MHSSDLFQSIEDALIDATRHLGGAKTVGVRLRPELEKDPEAAGRWWQNCLNPDHAQKPDLRQVFAVMRWAREVGYHGVMNFVCSDVGYRQTEPVTREDEQAELQRRLANMIGEMHSLMGKLGMSGKPQP